MRIEITTFITLFRSVLENTLLGCSCERNAQLTRFSVQVGTLNAQRFGGVGHPPSVMLQHSGDVIALEPQPRFAQLPGRRKPDRSAVEAQRRQDVLDLN